MKHEIIYTEQYALIVSDEQAKENDWGYIPFQGGEVKLVGKYFADDWKKVIAHRPLTDTPTLEGVALLPEFTQENDVQKKSRDFVKEIGGSQEQRLAFIDGYLQAKEIYKYTEEDLIKAIELAQTPLDYDSLPFIDEVMQSLQQPKRPEYFQNELEVNCTGNNNNGCFLDSAGHNCGCVSIRTTTNSKGQTELVGEYSYE